MRGFNNFGCHKYCSQLSRKDGGVVWKAAEVYTAIAHCCNRNLLILFGAVGEYFDVCWEIADDLVVGTQNDFWWGVTSFPRTYIKCKKSAVCSCHGYLEK
jgi:hypothetical protein